MKLIGGMAMQNKERRIRLGGVLVAGIMASCPLGAVADTWQSHLLDEAVTRKPDSQAQIFAHAKVIEEQDMANLRGGFTIAGIDMNFGATLRTMIDNIRLETVMNITQAGANIVSQTLQNTDAIRQEITQQAQQQVSQVGPTSKKSVVEVTPKEINLPGLKDFSGAVVQDAKGFSAALHNITRNAILSTVISNASNRTIRQELDIRLDIQNLDAVREAQLRSRIANALVR